MRGRGCAEPHRYGVTFAESDKAELSRGLHARYSTVDFTTLAYFSMIQPSRKVGQNIHLTLLTKQQQVHTKLISKPDTSTSHALMTNSTSCLKESPVSDGEQDFPHLRGPVLSELMLRGKVFYRDGCTGRAASRTQRALPQVSRWVMDVRDTCMESVLSEGCKLIPPGHPASKGVVRVNA